MPDVLRLVQPRHRADPISRSWFGRARAAIVDPVIASGRAPAVVGRAEVGAATGMAVATGTVVVAMAGVTAATIATAGTTGAASRSGSASAFRSATMVAATMAAPTMTPITTTSRSIARASIARAFVAPRPTMRSRAFIAIPAPRPARSATMSISEVGISRAALTTVSERPPGGERISQNGSGRAAGKLRDEQGNYVLTTSLTFEVERPSGP